MRKKQLSHALNIMNNKYLYLLFLFQSLISAKHRIEMIKRALKPNDWIKLDTWEADQTEWTRTYDALNHHYEKVKQAYGNECRLMFLCGADLLESFNVPNLWSDEHVSFILKNFRIKFISYNLFYFLLFFFQIKEIVGKFGLACINRIGSNAESFIYEKDILYDLKVSLIKLIVF